MNDTERLIHPVPRLLCGLGLLLVVDIIWVASSELTEHIFKTEQFPKPFFSSYLKISMFMLYLPGFLLYKPWRDQCRQWSTSNYAIVNDEDNNEDDDDDEDNDDDDDDYNTEEDVNDEDNVNENSSRPRPLSSSVFMPVNDGDKSSGAESEVETSVENVRRKSVRFNRVAEVRQMSPSDALYANIARLSYHASLRAQAALRRAASRLSVREIASLALTFSVLFFVGNYSYQMALLDTEAGIVNVLSSSSCLFTLLLGSAFPSNASVDKLTVSKFFAVCFSIVGVVLVSFSDLQRAAAGDFPPTYGALWALAGSLCYSCYIVFLRRKVDHEDKLDVPMFFGFVGLFNCLLLWPAFVGLHYSHQETFALPNSKQWMYLIFNGLFGTVVSELLWLWGCFLTSSLIATLAIGLTIPLTMFADVLVKKVEYGPLFYIGSLPMFVSFFLVTILTHYGDWDPLMDFFLWIYKSIKESCTKEHCSQNYSTTYVFDRQERESLINQEPSQSSADT